MEPIWDPMGTKAWSDQELHLTHWAACLYGGMDGGLRELRPIEAISFHLVGGLEHEFYFSISWE